MEQRKIEQILEQTNIVDVIREYIPLKRYGSNYKARCPFHDEKTASFVVSEKKQIFKCFGCGKAGNAITFLRDYEKISYIEAVKKLAQVLGITIEKFSQKTEDTKHSRLIEIYALANSFFRENLREYGKTAISYLEKRNISQELMEEFEIGYSLNSYTALYNHLIKKEIPPQLLNESGLFRTNERGMTDIFRDRIMFPIHSYTGKVVAFGGRILEPKENTGKYINSPTTPLYTKGNELYGLHRTRYEISKKNYALICEGYLDFLRLYEQGFKHSVASLGTALTEKQIHLLSRYTDQFYLLYDGDKAGEKAAIKAAGVVLRNGYAPNIVKLPQDYDPDNFLDEFGKERLQHLIDEAKSLPEYIAANTSLELTEKEKLSLLIEIINEVEEQITKELLINHTAELFDISKTAIQSKIRRKKPTQKTKVKTTIQKHFEERNLLILLLHNPKLHKKVAETLNSDYFFQVLYKKIFENILYQIYDGMKESAIVELFESEAEKEQVTTLLWEEKPDISMEELIRDVKLRKLRHDLAMLNKKIVDEHEKQAILLEKRRVKEEMRKLAGNKVVQKTLF